MKKLQFGIRAFFYTINRNSHNHNIISIRLSQSLNKGIWEFIKQNNCFMEFLQNCMDDTSRQIAITKQTISEVTVKVEIWDRNCDIDDMNCKRICVTFYTSEGTYKAYNFDTEILLSDFNIPAETAIMGNMLKELVRIEEVKYHNSIAKACLTFIGIFSFSWAVSYYFVEGGKVFILTIMLGMLITILWIIIEKLYLIKRKKKKKNSDFIVNIDVERKDTSIVFNELINLK